MVRIYTLLVYVFVLIFYFILDPSSIIVFDVASCQYSRILLILLIISNSILSHSCQELAL